MELKQLDVVVRGGVSDGLSMRSMYEVRVGPITIGDEITWHVSKPVEMARAIELAAIIVPELALGNAFMMPDEFQIVGRIEKVEQPKQRTNLPQTIDC